LLSCFAHCVSLRRAVLGIDTRRHSHPPLKPSAQGLSRQTTRAEYGAIRGFLMTQ
jgi:hypothetical protein